MAKREEEGRKVERTKGLYHNIMNLSIYEVSILFQGWLPFVVPPFPPPAEGRVLLLGRRNEREEERCLIGWLSKRKEEDRVLLGHRKREEESLRWLAKTSGLEFSSVDQREERRKRNASGAWP
jgi:hypothetical protein